jgi:hypothetical protein
MTKGAMMTSTLSTWKAAPGALTVTVRPLRPFLARPRLCLISPSEEIAFPFAPDDDGLSATLPGNVAERLLAAAGGVHLLLGMRALYDGKAPTRRWQWGIRLTQDGAALTGYGRNRISMPADADGFVRSRVHAFPQGRAHGYDEWVLALDPHPGHPAHRRSPFETAAHAGC